VYNYKYSLNGTHPILQHVILLNNNEKDLKMFTISNIILMGLFGILMGIIMTFKTQES